MGCFYDLLAFVANMELWDITVMEWRYCTRPHCICDCSLEGIVSSISLCGDSEINIVLMRHISVVIAK